MIRIRFEFTEIMAEPFSPLPVQSYRSLEPSVRFHQRCLSNGVAFETNRI